MTGIQRPAEGEKLAAAKNSGKAESCQGDKSRTGRPYCPYPGCIDREYGTEYRCYLNHETPWQLLIAVIMSAQCTDARVNIVTADLFRKYDTLEKFAAADLKELEQDIHPLGFIT